MADIGDTITPDSDQLDAVDLIDGPRTFTVARVVVRDRGEQPVDVHLVEFPRPWKPGKNQRRVLATLWGPSKDGAWQGRRLTLWRDPRVMYGGDAVGGVRVTHMSHIGEQERQAPIIPTRGKAALYPVKPLPDVAPQGGATSGRSQTDAVIGSHLARTGATKDEVRAIARNIAGRDVSSARDLDETETEALIVALAELPDKEQ